MIIYQIQTAVVKSSNNIVQIANVKVGSWKCRVNMYRNRNYRCKMVQNIVKSRKVKVGNGKQIVPGDYGPKLEIGDRPREIDQLLIRSS